MATIGGSVLTLADHAKRLDPDGKIASIVEILGQSTPTLADAIWQEGNLPTGTRTTIRTSLPTINWRTLNSGTSPSKSTTAQADENCGTMEAWSEVDVELAKLNGNVGAFRISEASAFIEAMGQEFESTLFYGNAGTAPEEFTGFSPRYASTTGNNGQNVILGGGSQSDNTSVWLINWSPSWTHCIFPKASEAGLKHEDLGEVTVETTAGIAGSRMRAYQDHFIWKCGLAVRDWRYNVRIPNIDIGNLTTESSAANLTKLMIKATHHIQSTTSGKPVFYMNRTVFKMLDIQRFNNVAVTALEWENIDGRRIPTFRGIPIRVTDALVENEALVA